jgi:hypothetical protein
VYSSAAAAEAAAAAAQIAAAEAAAAEAASVFQQLQEDVQGEPSASNARHEAMRDWLRSLDDGRGAMMEYFESIEREFDADLDQILALKLEQPVNAGQLGTVDPILWEACGVNRVGHRLLFARGINSLAERNLTEG